MHTAENSTRRADVVILTAVKEEYGAVLQVEAGAWPGSTWDKDAQSPNNLLVSFRNFQGCGERPLRVAVARTANMGAVSATHALDQLVQAYDPVCIAMCGVCAGRPGKTNLGDVIAADRLFFHDVGKQLSADFQSDITTYNLRDDWKVAIEHFDFAAHLRYQQWWLERPVPYAWQESWLLAKLLEGVTNPGRLPECDVACPQWTKVVERLWASELLEKDKLQLSTKGRAHIEKLLVTHRGQFPDISVAGKDSKLPFRVHVAPIGSGSGVIEDETYWGFVTDSMRKTLGLEMEAAAVGALAHALQPNRGRPLHALVMKGVMDLGNEGRDDLFKDFAARASAECLLAFLRSHLDPELIPGVDDLLVPGTEKMPADPPPSALLTARYQAVGFEESGRADILAELNRWCDEGPTMAVRLIHAEGGVGKTRLAIEWIRQRRAARWAAGFLAATAAEDWLERLWACGQSVVVVLDYAESRQGLQKILQRAQDYRQQEGSRALRRMRILLLARNCGDWWTALRQTDTGMGNWLVTTPPHELKPLVTNEVERKELFCRAVAAFSPEKTNPIGGRPLPTLSDKLFERVLYLHMAAIAFVEGCELAPNKLMDAILDHEERFWASRATADEVKTSERQWLARQMVAVATLRGGLADRNDARTAAERLLDHTPSDEEQAVLGLLHRVYERARGEMYLPALEPDLLGEAMVLRVAAPPLKEHRVSANWIERAFPPDDHTSAVQTGLEVLGRASLVSPALMRPWMERMLSGLLLERASLALNAAKSVGLRTAFSPLGEVLADLVEAAGDLEVARTLDKAILPFPTVSLCRIAEWTQRTLLMAVPESADEGIQEERARRLSELSMRLRALGRKEEALAAAREAVECFSLLVQRNPNPLLGLSLSTSLNYYGITLGDMEYWEEALAATRDAVYLGRSLAEINSDTFLPILAASLTNLGVRLIGMRYWEEALASLREALEHYRLLAQRNPDAFLPNLATSLSHLGKGLRSSGHPKEALAATREAVDLRRTLTERNPDAFIPDLVESLIDLGDSLIEMGREDEALAAIREAVDLRRRLAESNPDAFLHDLAASRIDLSHTLRRLGHQEEALDAANKAAVHYRILAEHNPDAFLSGLAASLHNVSAGLYDMDRKDEALATIREAVDLRRRLAEKNPDAVLPYLALSLMSLGAILMEKERMEDALTATREAIDISRPLAERDPEVVHTLVGSLVNLSSMLSEMGWTEEALAVAEEAANKLWPFFECNPHSFEHLAKHMLDQAQLLHKSLHQPYSRMLIRRIATFERLTKSTVRR
ncbi:MAG TPA: tetratricopeptide repeat protein [Archangium sp.]|uniref:tetratricopeptide repeat protein n=1 Tax=Archangium sp. TaxID=1872627 RepID=UPI002E34A467|nr:tetratricopeptide repeat protein [Archangium sp.]HEX5751169.1 tetratricopeptide repeat protein [Archangium sp.]